ncbi:LysR family transcriptional regulator [Ideonella sp. DXS22W]|uniref:LysR family transcriptional regulator n=1 Tax=Pseudaquabacterium inlustre TaxID=2984192 RepID=A0ABU9CG11_9BURK
MREFNLDRLRTLVTVADLGSFAAAAQALHLAPPTVTLHVAELEQRLGAPLLRRGRPAVTPTGAGALLIEHARRLLDSADAALDAVRRHIAGQAGRVRLGASTGAIAQLLPQALQALAATHPGIDVQVQVLTSAETLAHLATGTLDLGIVALPQPPRAGVRIEPWRQDPVLAVLPAAWEAPDPVTPDWLAAQPLVLNDGSTHLSRLCTEWFAQAGQRPTARIALNYNDAIRSLVAAGYGASLLPADGGEPPADARVQLRALQPPLWRPLGLVWRVDDGGDGLVAQVLAALRALPTLPGDAA